MFGNYNSNIPWEIWKRGFIVNKNPKGCSNIGGSAAARLEYCRNKALGLFSLYGYRAFSPAEFQLIEDVWNKLSPSRARRLITLTTPFGEPCVLRSDITLSAVAYLDSHYKESERPLRLCYADRIFSAPKPPRMNLEENQVGVEVLGWEGAGVEAEVISLLFRTLDALSVENSAVVLGDTSIISKIFEELPSEKAARLTEALQNSSYSAYQEIITTMELADKKRDLLISLPQLKGDVAVLSEVMRLTGDTELVMPFKKLCDTLVKLGYENRLKVDMGFIRDLGYYTGSVFNAYSSVSGALLGGGGRYDGLLSRIGIEGQGAGFAFNLKELAEHSAENVQAPAIMLWCGEAEASDALRYADGLAKKSVSFEMSWQKEKTESMRVARQRGYRWWIDYSAKKATPLCGGSEIALKEFETEELPC